MGCCLFIVALIAPRLAMVIILLLTDWFGVAFDGVLWPLLGFLFMPYTTLAYMAAVVNAGAVQGGWLVLLVVAVVVDVGHWGGGGYHARARRVGP